MNRRDLNKLINSVFSVSSEIIGSPRKRSSVEKYINSHSQYGELKYQYTVDIASIGNELPSFFHGHTLVTCHSVFLANLTNARVWGRNGAVVGAGDQFLENVSREFNKGLNIDHSIFYTIKQFSIKNYALRTAVIGTAGANVYYHWMMDVLPRLGLIAKIYPLEDISYFVTEFTQRPFQVETLNKIGIPINKIIASNDNWNFHIKCEELLVPSLVSPIDQVTPFQIDYLRTLFKESIVKQYPKERIYISRAKVGRRKIVNEPDLVNFLFKYGIRVVYPEDLSISQQVTLFSQASLIISSHGSALVNLVFCNPNTNVVDIFNEKHINPCFWFISKLNSLNYHYFQGKAEPIDNNPKNDNTRIDMKKFREYFHSLSI